MTTVPSIVRLNSAAPAPPAGFSNVKPQTDSGFPAANVSFYAPNLGLVDARTTTTETIRDASLGKLVSLTNGSAIAVTLDSAHVPNGFMCFIANLGLGTATLTPSSGTINYGGASTANLLLLTGQGATLFWDGTNWSAVLGATSATAAPFDIVFSPNASLNSSAVYDIVVFARTVTFPGNFSGAVGHCRVNPGSTQTITVNKNGSSVGAISITSSGVFSFTTTGGGSVSFAAGDYMTFTAQSSADANMIVSITLAGTR